MNTNFGFLYYVRNRKQFLDLQMIDGKKEGGEEEAFHVGVTIYGLMP